VFTTIRQRILYKRFDEINKIFNPGRHFGNIKTRLNASSKYLPGYQDFRTIFADIKRFKNFIIRDHQLL
jgi:hypothetical protein